MKNLLTIVLVTALCTPAFAQKSGMTNSNAPAIEQSISTGGAKITLNYTSITWASGSTMKDAMDKENGAATRERINQGAPKRPLAAFTSTVPVNCGELKLESGDYKVYFTISEACEWQVNFQGKDDKVATMKLPLKDSGEESARLLMCLYAGKEEGAAGVYVAFGNQMCTLDLTPGKAAKKA